VRQLLTITLLSLILLACQTDDSLEPIPEAQVRIVTSLGEWTTTEVSAWVNGTNTTGTRGFHFESWGRYAGFTNAGGVIEAGIAHPEILLDLEPFSTTDFDEELISHGKYHYNIPVTPKAELLSNDDVEIRVDKVEVINDVRYISGSFEMHWPYGSKEDVACFFKNVPLIWR